MDVLAIIRIAMRALARNKMRSALTMLGIIIGVGAVIAMVSVGQGAQQQAQQQIAAMGSNVLFVSSGTVNRGGMRMGWGATKTLVSDDMVAILRECPLVKEAAPGSQAMAQDQDDIILIPITTLQKKITGQDWLRWIMVSAVSREASYSAQQQFTELLRDRHRIRPGQDDDFFVRNLPDVADLADQQAKLFTVLLASIASISLIVGGIGIMNIMLVSVTERTREIGIRMAIGATEGDVQQQFLIEAVVLSLVGGAVGIISGMGASYLITQTLGWPVLVSPMAIVAAVVFSMAVGIFFGFYPARKAARMDPIEALRYE